MIKTATIPMKRLMLQALILSLVTMLCAWKTAYGAEGGFGETTKRVADNVSFSVRIIPMIGYVAGTFFTASGLLKLKDWIADGERNSIIPALVRLFVAMWMILLPHIMVVTAGTLFSKNEFGKQSTANNVHAPRLGAFCKSSATNCN